MSSPPSRRRATAAGADAAAVARRVAPLVAAHGTGSTSFQVLEPGFRYWFADDDACVAYSAAGGAWVAAGAPLAAAHRHAEVAGAFVAAARRRGRRVAFFGVEEDFLAATGLAALQVGEEPSWDPAAWPATVAGHRSLRAQLQRAAAHRVSCRRVDAVALAPGRPLRAAVSRLLRRWRAAQPMAAMGFVVQVELFAHLEARRVFVAEVAPAEPTGAPPALVGILSMVPVYGRRGWLCEDFLRDPDAPNGTVELLVDAAMRSAADAGGHYVTLGLAPLAGRIGPWLTAAARMAAGLYDFGGLYSFKAKLRPSAWAPIYLAYPAGGPSAAGAAVVDTLRAFAPRGLARFALETLLRGPSVVVGCLWVLLVPWTLALALMDTAAWFPSRWVHAGWVALDVGLTVALARLNRRWRPRLAAALSVVVSLDAAATLAEICLTRTPPGPGAAVVKTLAVAAPSLAAVVLWRARRHRRAWRGRG